MRWHDFQVPLTEAAAGVPGRTKVPLFVLGLCGLLQKFQLGISTGFWASLYDCKVSNWSWGRLAVFFLWLLPP
jgi:hypothetical protein